MYQLYGGVAGHDPCTPSRASSFSGPSCPSSRIRRRLRGWMRRCSDACFCTAMCGHRPTKSSVIAVGAPLPSGHPRLGGLPLAEPQRAETAFPAGRGLRPISQIGGPQESRGHHDRAQPLFGIGPDWFARSRARTGRRFCFVGGGGTGEGFWQVFFLARRRRSSSRAPTLSRPRRQPPRYLRNPLSENDEVETSFVLDTMSGASTYYLSSRTGASGEGVERSEKCRGL